MKHSNCRDCNWLTDGATPEQAQEMVPCIYRFCKPKQHTRWEMQGYHGSEYGSDIHGSVSGSRGVNDKIVWERDARSIACFDQEAFDAYAQTPEYQARLKEALSRVRTSSTAALAKTGEVA